MQVRRRQARQVHGWLGKRASIGPPTLADIHFLYRNFPSSLHSPSTCHLPPVPAPALSHLGTNNSKLVLLSRRALATGRAPRLAPRCGVRHPDRSLRTCLPLWTVL